MFEVIKGNRLGLCNENSKNLVENAVKYSLNFDMPNNVHCLDFKAGDKTYQIDNTGYIIVIDSKGNKIEPTVVEKLGILAYMKEIIRRPEHLTKWTKLIEPQYNQCIRQVENGRLSFQVGERDNSLQTINFNPFLQRQYCIKFANANGKSGKTVIASDTKDLDEVQVKGLQELILKSNITQAIKLRNNYLNIVKSLPELFKAKVN